MTSGKYDPSIPVVISEANLSHAWGRALCHVVKAPGKEIKPLLVSITGFDRHGKPEEDSAIRAAVDDFLRANDNWSIEIVAFTIFPQRYWQVCDGDRQAFYEICFDALPHIKARNPHLNGRGLYFERLMNFGAGKVNPNQLEFILTEYLEGRKRTSKFQASIFDPARDQSKQPYQTFPCLQTVSFVPTDSGLVVNAFYAMQYLVQRAYGNFLGLAHLGAFMAHEMGLPLAQLNVMAGVEKLDFSKADLCAVVDVASKSMSELEVAA